MIQKFYTNTIISKFIQSYLHDFYTPTLPTIKSGDFIVEGYSYVTAKGIIECQKSGIYSYKTTGSESSTEVDNIRAKYTRLTDYYELGQNYINYSENYISDSGYYDSKLHERFCNVVRCYSDLSDIDLMPYCNLFSDSYLANIRITNEKIDSIVQQKWKTIKIPIRFNRDYTIAIDCPSVVWIAPIFLTKDNFLMIRQNDIKTSITDLFTEQHNQIVSKNSMSFRQPETYSVKCSDPYFIKYEKNLYLLIQIPSYNDSTIVVLEGNFTETQSEPEIILNFENSDSFDNNELNNVLQSSLSLLQLNNRQSYPFSGRLIEYLLGNVITKNYMYPNAIRAIQDQFFIGYLQGKLVDGVWNEYTRAKVFQYIQNSEKVRHLDINGYVDKDSEQYFST